MELIHPARLENKHKVFLGALDSYVIEKNKINFDYILRRIKISLLLYDHILIPAAFAWQSPIISSRLDYMLKLLDNKCIIPVIRNPHKTKTIIDYFSRREDETSKLINTNVSKIPELSTEIALSSHKNIAKEISKYSSITYSDSNTSQDKFRETIQDDLKNSLDLSSIYNILLINCNNFKNRIDIINFLHNESLSPEFCRSYILANLKSLSINKILQKKLEKRISDIYLYSNAQMVNGDLFIPNNTFTNNKISTNLDLYISALYKIGITPELIDSLSLEDLLILRKSDIHRIFINKFHRKIRTINAFLNTSKLLLIKSQNRILLTEKISKILKKIVPKLSIANNLFISDSVYGLITGDYNFNILTTSSSLSIILNRINHYNNIPDNTAFIEFQSNINRLIDYEKL